MRKRAGKSEDRLEIRLFEVLTDATHEMGDAAALVKDGVERDLQELLAERPDTLGGDLRLVRREWATDIGPVDLMCRDDADGWVAVEIKRIGTIDAVEQLSRYLERIRMDPALARPRRARGATLQTAGCRAGGGAGNSMCRGRSRGPARRARARPHVVRVTPARLASLRSRHGGIRLRPTLRGGLIVHRGTVALLVLCAGMLLAVGTAGAASKHHSAGSVYTLTNSPAGNAVAVFERAKDGTLTPNGTYPTGGVGTGSNLGSQGALILSENGHSLFAVNAGSNTISQFRVTHDGLEWQATVPSGGATPTSLTQHGHVLYVLNAGGAGNITGFVVKHDELDAARRLDASARCG